MSLAFKAIPVFRIFDEDKAKEFYIGFLGFQLDWEHRFEDGMPLYMQISRENFVLHLSEHHGDCCPGSTVFVNMKGIEELHADISSKGYKYMQPGIEKAPWGARVMEVVDPFGNKIRFSEQLTGE